MTTSISNVEAKAEVPEAAQVEAQPAVYHRRFPHTVASRFLFLNVCVTIVLSALAYGTVHYWASAVFALGAALTVILWMIDGWRLRTLRISRNVLQLSLVGAIVLGLIQLLPLRDPEVGPLTILPIRTLSLDAHSTRLALIRLCALLIYFAATLVFTDSPRRLRLLVRTITIFGFMLAIFGLTQSFTSPTKVYWVREMTQSTPFGPFINRHHFAGYMELTLAIPLSLVFTGAVERDKRFIYLFAAGMMGVALIMTNSRGGIISLVAEVIFLMAAAGFGRRQNFVEGARNSRAGSAYVRAAMALGLIIALFVGVVLLGGESALSRFVGNVNTDDPTTGRAHFWSVTLDIIRAHPLVGTGLGAFGVVYTRYDSRNGLFRLEQAHNDYLQVLSDGGIVGAVLGLFFVVGLFRMGFARRESKDGFRRGVAIGALAGCFAVLIHSFFDFTLHTTANALLFLILAALATLNGRVEETQSHGNRRRRHRRHSVHTAGRSSV
jgi:O-antigen ligase